MNDHEETAERIAAYARVETELSPTARRRCRLCGGRASSSPPEEVWIVRGGAAYCPACVPTLATR